jgi:hypothetical protein
MRESRHCLRDPSERIGIVDPGYEMSCNDRISK